MFSSDKLRKLEDLAGKLAKSNTFLGSQWAKEKAAEGRPEAKAPRAKKDEMIKLEDAVRGSVLELPAGRCYHVRKRLIEAWPESVDVLRLHRDVFFGSGPRLDTGRAGEDLHALAHVSPQDITYLDIETCGFCGTMIFLIGWCYFDGEGDFIIEQTLARDYSEEASILHATAERLGRTRVLVSYNGKRFDLPSIQERAVIHRLKIPPVSAHVDLLDQTRARWKKYLPNCQLQTVETYLCRRIRRGDIAGADIPQVYHDFVKSTDARKLKTIIHHNFLDIVTLAEITIRLLAGHQPG